MSVPSILKLIVVLFITFRHGKIQLPDVSTEHQLADLFKKAMPMQHHDELITKLMSSPAPHQI